jgi:alpha-tubulin suppressor-like RCC1 family protein
MLVSLAGLLHCAGDQATGAAAGEEMGACYANGTCNEGLTCFSDRCVRYVAPESREGGTPDASIGSAGAAGQAGAGGTGPSDTSGGAGTSNTGGASGAAGMSNAGGMSGMPIEAGIVDAPRDASDGDSKADASIADAPADIALPVDADEYCPLGPPPVLPPNEPPLPAAPPDGGPGSVFSVATGASSTCASSQSGQLKCWGSNYNGKLGLGDLEDRGDNPNEMGGNLPFVSLGTGLRVKKVGLSSGSGHICALFDNGRVKCWGDNQLAQLGLGDSVNRGEMASQMGDNLPFVDLGTGRTVTTISVGAFYTCVILDTGKVKCWGTNRLGELGLGDTTSRGGAPGQMGDNLPIVNLGACHTVKAVSAGRWGHVCAILGNGQVKCWGTNQEAELGVGDSMNRGDKPDQMGDALPAVRLGTGRTATAIATGMWHTCALLDNGKVKCWGQNSEGELGVGDRLSRGNHASDMGDNLPEVDLGTGRTATAISLGQLSSCALLDNGQVKCWGRFLGLGQYPSELGWAPGQMGDALPALELGTGRSAKTISAGSSANCALLDNGEVKCWATNFYGELGQGDTTWRGNFPGQMGDALPAVPLW